MMQDNKYDVVLMDLQMPIMDGLESVRRLRSHESQLNVSNENRQLIIGMSASDEVEIIKSVFAVKMDDFMSKPFSILRFTDLYILHLLKNNIFLYLQ